MTETIGYLLISFNAARFFVITFATATVLLLFMYFIIDEHMPLQPVSIRMRVQLLYVFICLIIAGAPIFVSWAYQHKAINACKMSADCDYAAAYKAAQELDKPAPVFTTKV